MRDDFELEIEGKVVHITNPKKALWPELEIHKLDYIRYLIEMAPYILPYTTNRLLTTIRFPNGIHGKSFYQKNVPEHAPEWLQVYSYRDTNYIVASNLPTLVWLGNQASLELHVTFNLINQPSQPTELVFDLDPTDVEDYSLVLETSCRIKEILDSLGLYSQPKTSGATGIQIYLPIATRYSYEETRQLNKFIAQYIEGKYPHLVTLERLVKNRGTKLYFDYLQHWEGKTLPAPYSARARTAASVSAPVTWEEVYQGFHPTDFTLRNMKERIDKMGDLFSTITTEKKEQSLDELLNFIKIHA
ncbi:MAG TPA: non-homologous end-joining DNA ligase [Bacillota bacterium]|nr:non-homologous end-joining DNA ligase [Bacillota bacterium]